MQHEQGALLLTLARQAIGDKLGLTPSIHLEAAWLAEPGASFVTLKKNNTLRGCIGSLEASRALKEDIWENARAAAFSDSRFSPLTRDEFGEIEIEVSLLSSLTPLNAADEQEACARLRPGIDGVVLQYGIHRATFLPQVWEHLPKPHDFLAHLKTKAGLAADFWDKKLNLSCYTVSHWHEQPSVNQGKQMP